MTTFYALTTQTLTSDAAYQAFLTHWLATMTGAGLVQTADTGQVNPATATRPATNTTPDYLVFRFDDALQGTAPIFIKMNFGTGASLGLTAINATVSTQTDGAGGMGSPSSATTVSVTGTQSNLGSSWAGNRHTLACHTEGFFFVSFHTLESAGAFAGFFVARTVDVSGNPTAEGFLFQRRNGGTGGPGQVHGTISTTFKYGSPNTIVASMGNAQCFPPGLLDATFVGLDRQVYLTWGAFPKAQPLNQLFTYRVTELTYLTPVEVTLFGTQRTYMPVGFSPGGSSEATNSINYGLAFLWE